MFWFARMLIFRKYGLSEMGPCCDYVEMQWLMLQQEQPEDFVIATGEQYSVRDFIKMAAAELKIDLAFEGKAKNEVAVVKNFDKDLTPNLSKGQIIIKVDPRYFRPAEVETLLGDPTKANQKLGWKPRISTRDLCNEMIASDINIARQKKLVNDEKNNFRNIFVCGHNGMVGAAVLRRLKKMRTLKLTYRQKIS